MKNTPINLKSAMQIAEQISKVHTTFASFEPAVKKNAQIKSLLSPKYINIVIQKFAAELD